MTWRPVSVRYEKGTGGALDTIAGQLDFDDDGREPWTQGGFLRIRNGSGMHYLNPDRVVGFDLLDHDPEED